MRLLRRFTDRLAFALDSDLAGDAAARRGIEIADAAGMDMRVVTLPSGKDPDDAARDNPGLLKKAIKDAVPVYDYFLSSATSRFDAATAYGKKKISDELVPTLTKIDNPIVQNHYVKKLAITIGTSEDSIAESMRRTKQAAGRALEPETPARAVTTRPEKLETYILALLLQGKTRELFDDLAEEGLLPEFMHAAVHKIIDHLVTFLESSRVFLIKDFADSLPPELTPTLDEAFLWDIADIIADDEVFTREWHHALVEFRKSFTRRKMYELTRRADVEKLRPQLKAFSDTLKSLEKSR